MSSFSAKLTALVILPLSFSTFATTDNASTEAPSSDAKAQKEVQDMSDPLAVYTQVGAGYTNKGLNIKIGQTYDTHNPITAAMNVLEVKGFAGEALGWTGNSSRDDSIDSFRFRNFGVNLTNGRAHQIDINYNIDGNPLVTKQTADISYSFIQALPK